MASSLIFLPHPKEHVGVRLVLLQHHSGVFVSHARREDTAPEQELLLVLPVHQVLHLWGLQRVARLTAMTGQ